MKITHGLFVASFPRSVIVWIKGIISPQVPIGLSTRQLWPESHAPEKKATASKLRVDILLKMDGFRASTFAASRRRKQTRRAVASLYFDFFTGLRYLKRGETRPVGAIDQVRTTPAVWFAMKSTLAGLRCLAETFTTVLTGSRAAASAVLDETASWYNSRT